MGVIGFMAEDLLSSYHLNKAGAESRVTRDWYNPFVGALLGPTLTTFERRSP